MSAIAAAILSGYYDIIDGEHFEISNWRRDDSDSFNADIFQIFVQMYDLERQQEQYAAWFHGVHVTNFGIDDEKLYINFPYAPALHGFLILAIPLDAI